MPNSFVQQHPTPTWTKHHGQHTGWCSYRVKIDLRLAHRLTSKVHCPLLFEEITVIGTSTTTGTAALTPAIVFNNHTHIKTNQRTHISS